MPMGRLWSGPWAEVEFRSLPAIPAAPRAVAQLGSVLDWGSSGRRFKSCQPDKKTSLELVFLVFGGSHECSASSQDPRGTRDYTVA